METFLQNLVDSEVAASLVDNWILIVGIILVVVVVAVAYSMFVSRLERRVSKAWLGVYEKFLERADKVPLLTELVREGAKEGAPDYESLLEELIVARGATSHKSFPTEDKRLAEKSFEEVLQRVIGEVSEQPALKKHALFLSLLKEFNSWDTELQLCIIAYGRSLRTYRSFALGSMPDGYGVFEY